MEEGHGRIRLLTSELSLTGFCEFKFALRSNFDFDLNVPVNDSACPTRSRGCQCIFTTYLPGFPLKAVISFHEGQRTIWPDGVLYQLTIAARGLWRHHHHRDETSLSTGQSLC